MHKRRNKKIKFLLEALVGIGLVLFFVIWAGYYFFLTTHGADFFMQKVLPRYLDPRAVSYASVRGNLARGLVFTDVVVRNWDRLPQGAVLKIQQLGLRISVFGARDFHAEIENARLLLPGSDPIMVWGKYVHGTVDLDIYSLGVNLGEVQEMLARAGIPMEKISGTVNDVNVHLSGTYPELIAQGKFGFPELALEKLTAVDCQGKFHFKIKCLPSIRLNGVIDVEKGTLSGTHTAVVILKPGRLLFHGDPQKPVFDLRGQAIVANIKIEAILRGSTEKPDLQLFSQPPLSQDRLLVMLATNKAWQGAGDAFGNGPVPADLVKDFIDYFIFSGKGSELAQKLGISDLSVKYDALGQGIDIKKDIFENFKATYGVEQRHPQQGDNGWTTQKLGGELKLDKDTSIGIEQRTKQPTLKSRETSAQDNDQELMIKFKRGF